jgi:hypothetical protein
VMPRILDPTMPDRMNGFLIEGIGSRAVSCF